MKQQMNHKMALEVSMMAVTLEAIREASAAASRDFYSASSCEWFVGVVVAVCGDVGGAASRIMATGAAGAGITTMGVGMVHMGVVMGAMEVAIITMGVLVVMGAVLLLHLAGSCAVCVSAREVLLNFEWCCATRFGF